MLRTKDNRMGLLFSSTIILLGTSFLLPVLLFKEYGDKFSINLSLAWFIMIYSISRLCYMMVRGKKQLIDMAFYVFVFVWFGYIAFISILTNTFPLTGTYTQSEIMYGFFVIIIGIMFYEIGKKFVRGTQYSVNKTWVPKLKFFYITSTVSIIISAAMIVSIGGVSSLFLSRGQLNSMSGDTNMSLLITTTLLRTPVFSSLLVGIMCLRQHKKSKPLIGMVTFLFIMTFMTTNFISSPRYWFGTVVLTVTFMIFKWNKNSFTKWTLAFIVILLFIFPYSDLFRRSVDNINLGSLLKDAQSGVTNLAHDGDYDGFQMTLNTIRDAEHSGYSYGQQLLVSAFFFVPRSIWHNKPFGTGQTVATDLGYSFTNLSAPLWAEGYFNFGIIGVIILFFIYGFFVQSIQKRYMSENISFAKIFVPFFAAYQFFLLRGELLSGITYLTPFAVATWIIYSIVGTKNKKY